MQEWPGTKHEMAYLTCIRTMKNTDSLCAWGKYQLQNIGSAEKRFGSDPVCPSYKNKTYTSKKTFGWCRSSLAQPSGEQWALAEKHPALGSAAGKLQTTPYTARAARTELHAVVNPVRKHIFTIIHPFSIALTIQYFRTRKTQASPFCVRQD